MTKRVVFKRAVRVAGDRHLDVPPARITEGDNTRPEHHVIYLRVVTCSMRGCTDRAGAWMRCSKCKELVARCGAHVHNLPQQTQEHCRG